MTKQIFIIAAFFSLNVYANPYCKEQINFDSSFNKIENYLTISIQRKDKQLFESYTLNTNDSMNHGIILLDSRIEKTNIDGYGSGGFSGPSNYLEMYRQFYFLGQSSVTYSQNSLSSYIMQANTSQVYKLPIKNPVKYQHYTKIINLNYFLYYYNDLLNLNNIKGPQRIKFYITFLHNQNTGSCSYYETKPFIYNFNVVDYKVTNSDGYHIDYDVDKTKYIPIVQEKEKNLFDKLKDLYDK